MSVLPHTLRLVGTIVVAEINHTPSLSKGRCPLEEVATYDTREWSSDGKPCLRPVSQ